jgi:hypothetical protein
MTAVVQRITVRNAKVELPLMVKQQDKTMQNGDSPHNNFKAGYTPLVFDKNKIKKQKTVIECEVLENIVSQERNVHHIAECRSRNAQYKVISKIGQHGQKSKHQKAQKKTALAGVGVVFSHIVNEDKNDKYRRTKDNV